MKIKVLFGFIFILCISLQSAMCQDSTSVTKKNVSAFAVGIGIPTGLNLSFSQKIIPTFFLSISAGLLVDRYTLSIGSGFQIEGSSNIAVRYTITSLPPVSFERVKDKGFSLFYHFFNFNTSIFYWGIGVVFPSFPLPFAEIGIRLFSF